MTHAFYSWRTALGISSGFVLASEMQVTSALLPLAAFNITGYLKSIFLSNQIPSHRTTFGLMPFVPGEIVLQLGRVIFL
jgi:hypothetical protein